jgi:hypothetical protein
VLVPDVSRLGPRARDCFYTAGTGVVSNVVPLHTPADLWERGIDHLERAASCFQTAGGQSRERHVREVAAREVLQIRMLRDRVRPEQLTLQLEGRGGPAA